MKKIKQDFIESWNDIENFYLTYPDDNRPFTQDAVRLIKEMRNTALDTKLRAGQMLSWFILSRNKHHGLDNETHIQIIFLGNNQMEVTLNCNGEEKSQKQTVTYDGFLKEITQKLLKQDIVHNQDCANESDALF